MSSTNGSAKWLYAAGAAVTATVAIGLIWKRQHDREEAAATDAFLTAKTEAQEKRAPAKAYREEETDSTTLRKRSYQHSEMMEIEEDSTTKFA